MIYKHQNDPHYSRHIRILNLGNYRKMKFGKYFNYIFNGYVSNMTDQAEYLAYVLVDREDQQSNINQHNSNGEGG